MTAVDLDLLLFTLSVSGLAVVLNLPLAVVLARWTARAEGWFANLVHAGVSLPLALPPVAVGLFLLDMTGAGTPVGQFLDRVGLEVAFTWKGVLVALMVMSFPLIYLPSRAGFGSLDRRLEKVSLSLGRGRLYTFFRVSLPLAFPGILAGVLLGWARAIGEFGCTIVLAGDTPGRTRTVSLAIYHRFLMGDDPGALRLSILVSLIALLIVLASSLLQNGGR